MKRLSIFALLGVFAFLVLAVAAISLGGLNQDEGWYLYAAKLIHEGRMPYRDFFFTQGPVMPLVYSAAVSVWDTFGLVGARVMTLAIGVLSIGFAMGFVRRVVTENHRSLAAILVFLLLGCNLYHLYYLAIPKTYALASLFVNAGFFLLTFPRLVALGGFALALAAGSRISLGATLAVTGCWYLFRREWKSLGYFSLGGFVGLALVYGPFVLDDQSLNGLLAAQHYHAARGGFDPVFTIGSCSRLVRWYLPLFLVLGLGLASSRAERGERAVEGKLELLALIAFLAVFAVQMLAPFPYEDYQVPVMGLLAIFAVAAFVRLDFPRPFVAPLLVIGLSFAAAFGSPLLEEWMTNGQDRFWSLKKAKTELAQLQEAAAIIEALDPGGTELLTQDTYLAIETARHVPRGLEMGPFSYRGSHGGVGLSKAEFLSLIEQASCPVAALSGYTFAITTPTCEETAMSEQLELWRAVKAKYELACELPAFGQNATTLLILKRK